MILEFRNSIIDHVLNQNDWMREKLSQYENKVITLIIGPFTFDFIVCSDGNLKTIKNPSNSDTKIQMSIDAFIKTFITKEKKGINISGDIDLARDFADILSAIEWDIEDDLSRIFGDIVAHEISQAGKSFMQQNKRNVLEISGALVEFWQEENKILSKKNDVHEFIKNVDHLNEDVYRFEARLDKFLQSEAL